MLLGVALISGKIKEFKKYKPKDFLIIASTGLLGTFFYYVFYYAGNKVLAASQAFIINYMWPMMSVVFAIIILKEKLTFRKAIAILVSFLGVGVVMGKGILQFNKGALVGALMCLLAAVSYGLFAALNKKTGYEKISAMLVGYFAAFVLTGIILAIRGELFIPKGNQLLGIAWNGMFTMSLANTLWVIALSKGDTAKISNLAYITPFISLIWTSIFLKEKIEWTSVIGLLIIVIGIFIQLDIKVAKKQKSK